MRDVYRQHESRVFGLGDVDSIDVAKENIKTAIARVASQGMAPASV